MRVEDGRQDAPDRPGITPWQVEFSGSGGEYFRVWIVNVLLTVLTLGLYTPFSRRRTAQYFYSHTLVAGSPLEFTAARRKMAIGFVIGLALYVALKVASETGQDTQATLMAVAGAALAPWFWGSAMRFRLNATRWRGVRLQFTASWGEVYRASWPVFAVALAWLAVFLLGAALSSGEAPRMQSLGPAGLVALAVAVLAALAVTLLCVVRLEYNYKGLLVARGRIGGQAGRWKPVFGDFLRIWLATAGLFLACVAAVTAALVLLVVSRLDQVVADVASGRLPMFVLVMLTPVLLFLVFLSSSPARAYREARMFRLVWSNVGISQVARFRSDLQVGRYVFLRLRNLLFTLLTLGFFRPFAMVSEYRMKSESVVLHVKGGLDQLAGQLAREEDGLGDAIAGAVGLDLVG
jgi:uncharacterized membrane protein YjgN (DUF898 family)